MKISVTGGMGCGKSTVINALSDLLPHYQFASYDAEVKRLYNHDGEFREALRKNFGTLQKSEVATIVFNDRQKLDLLIKLTEVPMWKFFTRVTRNLNVAMEVPMLYQIPGASGLFDKVFAIWCDAETQRARIKARDGLSDEMIDRKLAIQLSPDEIASKADFVIDTSDGAVDVHVQLEAALRVAELGRV